MTSNPPFAPHPLPVEVLAICRAFNGWVVGGAANPNTVDPPKDYDIVIPFGDWPNMAPLIPKTASVNGFGGWKFDVIDPKIGPITIDVWPGDLSRVLSSNKCQAAYHPLSDYLWVKIPSRRG